MYCFLNCCKFPAAVAVLLCIGVLATRDPAWALLACPATHLHRGPPYQTADLPLAELLTARQLPKVIRNLQLIRELPSEGTQLPAAPRLSAAPSSFTAFKSPRFPGPAPPLLRSPIDTSSQFRQAF